jgi:hypothetical protein
MLIPQYLRDPDEEVAEMTQKKLRDSKVANYLDLTHQGKPVSHLPCG